MNAIDLLKEDHDIVDALFKEVEATTPSRYPPLFKRIKGELDTHAHLEEKIFYPQLIAKGDKELRAITKEGLEEHAQIKKFLAEIARSTNTEKREAKLKVLIEDTRHHVKEEENEMFPMVRDQFSSETLDELGARMEAERAKFQKSKRITPRRRQPKGVIEKVMDKAKDVAASIVPGGTKGNGSATRKRKTARTSAGAKTGRTTHAKPV